MVSEAQVVVLEIRPLHGQVQIATCKKEPRFIKIEFLLFGEFLTSQSLRWAPPQSLLLYFILLLGSRRFSGQRVGPAIKVLGRIWHENPSTR